jgi:RNA polymerase sigma factor (TIGR02999 family)
MASLRIVRQTGGKIAPMSEVTRILLAIKQGDPDANGELLPLVYEELRQLAQAHLARERSNHTLQATALVHEAYLRMIGPDAALPAWNGRGHFFSAAAEAMRRILIDHARKKASLKRGGGLRRVVTDVADLAADSDAEQIIKLDQLIQRLEGEEPRTAEVLKLRYYAGLSVEDTAATLGLSERTVKREWRYARAWMIQAMQ